ncbi:hypothetical protein [Azospirillum canadense]|uniref:hypothetical protein n=1 Tax=Azospirillum canadense TaxID=403962 RepID=UPI0022269463|nr:hypothetical protein [Azospirillum canadense]MCW2242776.1 hypothetical protein [Azospirillum canadense]
MALQTHIIVQPYVSGKKGALAPAPAIKVNTADAGRARAQRIMEIGRFLGVDVVQTELDEEAGNYGEPAFLLRLGLVPTVEA